MANRLTGRTVALTGPRKAGDMVKIVEKMGGTALIRPAQGTVFLDDSKVRSDLADWIAKPPAWTILTTGMGLDALFGIAAEMGMEAEYLEMLRNSSIAARGYKTVNALRKRGLTPLVRDDDGSTSGLIRGLEEFGFQAKDTVLQLHGDPAPRLEAWLLEQGTEVRKVLPYQHIPPEPEQLEQLLRDILEHRIDAAAFTSAPQVRNLAEHARSQGKLDELVRAFQGPVVASAVGKITAQALLEEGITRVVYPSEDERMGSMLVELARYFQTADNENPIK
ncbi:uroporphyrinogen-III synthase [Paenibacillus sp. HJL G12]|uniref:Uroporphyrinogen-III synthase n=1 Tax=Paenibacillus dendrobii TaxID=2691084 RepID=A0A7X3IMY6_9BACL|nr:uroporphyrinogen-III synthase [Paenibacillus dendrobii]MWV46513.1 uroporphyrinogen-III synthase [Paenibacillus dendrobii]